MSDRAIVSMRLKDMRRVHPEQVEKPCSRCGELCGVYPTGQAAMARYPDAVLLCVVCALETRHDNDRAEPAGGWDEVLTEMSQSVRKQ